MPLRSRLLPVSVRFSGRGSVVLGLPELLEEHGHPLVETLQVPRLNLALNGPLLARRS